MTMAGKEVKKLTDSPAIDGSPSWSSDGRLIVFDSNRSGSQQIWMMDRDGDTVTQLTEEKTPCRAPKWIYPKRAVSTEATTLK